MVLATMKEASGRRSVQSKSGKAITNLALPPEERKLRTTFKHNAYTDLGQSFSQNATMRGGRNAQQLNTSTTSYEAAKAYDLLPGIQSATRLHGSFDQSDPSLERQMRTKSKWELVCSRKE